MRRLSVKVRVTLWYAALMVLFCVLLVVLMMAAAERTARAFCQETLENAAAVILEELEYADGELEIDADIDDTPNVYASLFEADGRLLYGRRRVELPFEDGELRRASSGTHDWYVLDKRLTYSDRPDVWLRLYTSADVAASAYASVRHFSLWIFPLLTLLALAGGYLLTARAFLPVKRMAQLAASIADGSDLSRRIGLQNGARDELYALAGTFDAMLERLEHSFERERQFTSDVAHELRTPMNAIATQAEFALSRADVQEKDGALMRILAKNEEMSALVHQLLLLARMESGQLPQEDTCAVEAMLSGIVEDLQPVAQEREIRMEQTLCPANVRGNRAMLTRAFVNLIDNAIRYGHEGGVVRLRMENDGQSVTVEVEDDGPGMDAASLEHIFDRFWRGDSARSTPGTGIGLAIVRSVVNMHGGQIRVESAVGKGTRFTVQFPLEKIF